MKTQTIINCAFAVAFVGYVVWQRNPTFDTITCKGWKVVDSEGKERITAEIFASGTSSMGWLDKDGQMRIWVVNYADGNAGMHWIDKEGKFRIASGTDADGIVYLPTKDQNPPKKP
jgi:hypothetical protein